MLALVENSSPLPPVMIGAADHERLIAIARDLVGPSAQAITYLLSEIGRARIVDQEQLPDDVVRVGSTVSFTTPDGFDRTYQIVFPDQADISSGKVSVLTPIGAALIGLSRGHDFPWTARDGRKLTLTVVNVVQPGRTPKA